MPTPADHVLRPLTPDDFAASSALGVEAFGALPAGPDRDARRPTIPAARASRVGHLRRRRPRWRGWSAASSARGSAACEVPTCGVAGVAVAAERRGTACSATCSARCSTRPRERGRGGVDAVPTAPGIYRSLGYELVGSYDTVEVRPRNAGPGPRRRRRDAPAGRRPADFDAVRRGVRPLGGRAERPAHPPRPGVPRADARLARRVHRGHARGRRTPATWSASRAGGAARGTTTTRRSRSTTCSR